MTHSDSAQPAGRTPPVASARPRFLTTDPATNRPGRSYEGHTVAEALSAVRASRRAWLAWRRTPFSERSRFMHAAAAVLRAKTDTFAELMTAEMGKTLRDGRAEIEKCAFACDFFADSGEHYLAPRAVDIGGPRAFITYNPLGVILGIMPWNFPFWQVLRCAVPALMAGNAFVLKHASNVPGCALAIEGVFAEAGFPEHLFTTVLLPSRDVGPLIDDQDIAAVTLTGSVDAGRKVAAASGAALKKTVLELGGSDAYVVLADAGVAKAADIAAAARMVNGGQSCIAGKRFVVVEPIRAAFERALAASMAAFVMDDPRDPSTRLGPMVSVEARDAVHAQVSRSVALGARLLAGGVIPPRAGAWYPPTVLGNVKAGMPAFDDEVFGPVAAVIAARDEAEAIAIANGTPFGLGSGVITRDLLRGQQIAADELEAGISFVNAPVRSDPRLPFGGVKHSGYGRECSEFGIREFVNVKTVVVEDLGTTTAAALANTSE